MIFKLSNGTLLTDSELKALPVSAFSELIAADAAKNLQQQIDCGLRVIVASVCSARPDLSREVLSNLLDMHEMRAIVLHILNLSSPNALPAFSRQRCNGTPQFD